MAVTRTTELEAVNTILSVMGEAPINALNVTANQNVETAQAILQEVLVSVQSKGWHFNTERKVTLSRNGSNEFPLPTNALEVDSVYTDADIDVVARGSRLYNRTDQTYSFPDNATLYADIIYGLDWDELPEAARQYIKIRAARTAQERDLASENIHKFTEDDERIALATLMAAEVRQMNVNLFTSNMSTAQMLYQRRRTYLPQR
jgi:hypothetical protein